MKDVFCFLGLLAALKYFPEFSWLIYILLAIQGFVILMVFLLFIRCFIRL